MKSLRKCAGKAVRRFYPAGYTRPQLVVFVRAYVAGWLKALEAFLVLMPDDEQRRWKPHVDRWLDEAVVYSDPTWFPDKAWGWEATK